VDWRELLIDVEDLLFAELSLNVWERALYYNLLRRTHAAGVSTVLVSLPELVSSLSISEWKVRDAVRSLADKGAIGIEERSRKGHLIRTVLPEELGLSRPEETSEPIDIEAVDFYTNRSHVAALVRREHSQCFYCLRDIAVESCVLDHVVPQVDGGDNSYRNIVACCHDCNARKQGASAADFIRSLYRSSMLSAAELEARIEALEALRDGKLIPSAHTP
jgi:hypothetical protein